MIKETSVRLLRELELGLERLLVQVNDPLERLVQSLKLVQDALKKLKQLFLSNPFPSPDLEAYFFKYIKPAFYCWKIYSTEMYTIETGLPFGDTEKQISFLEDELTYIERYLKKYNFQYEYYKLNGSDLDGLYFIRGVEVQSILLPNIPDLDKEFSTSCDYLFSKFKAFDMLKDWLNQKVAYLRTNPSSLLTSTSTSTTDIMSWTGDGVNLAELGYALYFTKQLNNGTTSIAQIFRWLEQVLNVTIGIPAKRFAEIRGRKRLSRTRFIDEMRDSIINKLDQEDYHNPIKRKNDDKEPD